MVCDRRNESIASTKSASSWGGPLTLDRSPQHETKRTMERVNSFVGFGTSRKDNDMHQIVVLNYYHRSTIQRDLRISTTVSLAFKLRAWFRPFVEDNTRRSSLIGSPFFLLTLYPTLINIFHNCGTEICDSRWRVPATRRFGPRPWDSKNEVPIRF